jgi:thiamine-phosphate pyrophosphorylase
MPLKLQRPAIYLITSGKTTAATTPATKDFSQIVDLVKAAVAAEVDLLQLREKNLTARVLYKLTVETARITRSTGTRLLVNDRADIASSAQAHGVHLTTRSLPTSVVRKAFGADFLVGASTHSIAEASAARDEGADFAVFGPVFATASKQTYGRPVGLEHLAQAVSTVAPFPILGLGGVELDRVADCFRAGAAGIAGIRLFEDRSKLATVVALIRKRFLDLEKDG